MRNLFVLMIFIVFLHTSCGNVEPTMTNYFYVKNASSHQVKLTVFNAFIQTRGSYMDTSILINKDSEILNYYSGKGVEFPARHPFGFFADSAYIVFDNSVRIIYLKNDSIPRNILHIDSYNATKKDEDLYEYTYIITEDDFNRAIPIK